MRSWEAPEAPRRAAGGEGSGPRRARVTCHPHHLYVEIDDISSGGLSLLEEALRAGVGTGRPSQLSIEGPWVVTAVRPAVSLEISAPTSKSSC